MRKKIVSYLFILFLAGIFCGCYSKDLAETETSTLETGIIWQAQEESKEPETTQKEQREIQGIALNEKGSVYEVSPEFIKDSQYVFYAVYQDNILLITAKEDTSQMILYDPVKGIILREGEIGIPICADSKVQVSKTGEIQIYDSSSGEILFINERFEETERIKLNGGCLSEPFIDGNGKKVYYFTREGKELICFDRDSKETVGISCDLCIADYAVIETLLFSDEIGVISGGVESEEEISYGTYFIDLSSGKVLEQIEDGGTVTGWNDSYCTILFRGMPEIIFGSGREKENARELIPEQDCEYDSVCVDLKNQSAFSCYFLEDTQDNACLSCYDLTAGQKKYEAFFQAGGDWPILEKQFCYLPQKQLVFLSYYADSQHFLVWDLSREDHLITDRESCVWKYSNKDSIDEEKMAVLRAKAETIGETYGVDIYFADECERDFYDYTAETIYNIRLIDKSLDLLNEKLSCYPDGFFRQLDYEYGPLQIYICGNLCVKEGDGLTSAGGLYNQMMDEQYIVLNVTDWEGMKSAVFHEISHAIDKRVEYEFVVHDYTAYSDEEWGKLNPEGFEYDYSYVLNQETYDQSYTPEGEEEVYFIDMYAKSFPTEDRARILEHAMDYRPEEGYYTHPKIREKLEYMCSVMRQIFDTSGWDEAVCWEIPLSVQ